MGLKLAECGEAVFRLYALLETVRLEDTSLLNDAAEALARALRGVVPIAIEDRDGSLLVNRARLRVDFKMIAAIQATLTLLRSCTVGGLEFKREVGPLELIEVARQLVAGGPDLTERIESVCEGVGVLPPNGSDHRPRERSVTTLSSVFVAEELLADVASAGLQPRLVKSIVTGLVDSMLAEGELLGTLSGLRANRELFRHSAMVAVYAVMLGRWLGVPDGTLVEIGVGALLHDVGRSLDEGSHRDAGFRRLLRLPPSSMTLRVLGVVREHHDDFDDSAIEEVAGALAPAMVRLADEFDYAMSEHGDRACAFEQLELAAERGEVPRQLVAAFDEALALVEV